jgi:hypothetical protein
VLSKVSGEVNLDGLDSGAGHRDSEILTRLGWIGRHDYRFYPNRVIGIACLPVSRLFEPGRCIRTAIDIGPLVGKLNGLVAENLLLRAGACECCTCENREQGQ